MENHQDAVVAFGYIKVRLKVGDDFVTAFQVVDQGEVTGYVCPDGTKLDLPEVYEMTILDGRTVASIATVALI